MKIMRLISKTIAAMVVSLMFLASCTTYDTSLVNHHENTDLSKIKRLKKGKACGKNLFGGITLPYLGSTAIPISGNSSVVSAIENGKIKKVRAIDTKNVSYVLFSKKCTIVFGE